MALLSVGPDHRTLRILPLCSLHPQDTSESSELSLPHPSRNLAQPESRPYGNRTKILRTLGQRGTWARAMPRNPRNPALVQLRTLRITRNPLSFPFPSPHRNSAQPGSRHNRNCAKILRTLGQRCGAVPRNPLNPPNPPLVQLCTLSLSRNSAQPESQHNWSRAKIL